MLSCQHGPKCLWNVSSTLVNLCHEKSRHFWWQKRVQPAIIMVYLIKWPVSLRASPHLSHSIIFHTSVHTNLAEVDQKGCNGQCSLFLSPLSIHFSLCFLFDPSFHHSHSLFLYPFSRLSAPTYISSYVLHAFFIFPVQSMARHLLGPRKLPLHEYPPHTPTDEDSLAFCTRSGPDGVKNERCENVRWDHAGSWVL